MGSVQELLELSRNLKQERLFVNSERQHLLNLNEDVMKTAENLYHVSWITRQQRVNLQNLILTSTEATPAVCCQKAHALETVTFVDGYKYLSYHDSRYGEFLKNLRESPKLVAMCLAFAEKHNIENTPIMIRTFINAIYGNCVMPEDEVYVLQMLKSLIDLQVAINDDPRRLLRKGSCAFSTVFKLLNEGVFSAKLFLTAGLHLPIMRLLMEDEWFYDIDPDKALVRFPLQERQRRFGVPGSDHYKEKLKRYRQFTNDKLFMLTERFITSIKHNMYCFPQSLCWIVNHMYQAITIANRIDATEARAMCADLVFSVFVCPAICDPEPYGITSDAPISYIARHNLMQVAQIIQVLALSKWEEIDPKLKDLYGKFEKGCVSTLLDSILEGSPSDVPPQARSQLQGLTRSAVLISPSELQSLVVFLRRVMVGVEDGSSDQKALEALLHNLPLPSAVQAKTSTPSPSPAATPPGTPSSQKKTPGKGKEKRRLMLSPGGGDATPEAESEQDLVEQEDVLVITIQDTNDCPGLLPENKVLSMETENRQRKVKYYSLPGDDDSITESEIHEKRTRFSLSHDQDSIEGASSHSVGSDPEEIENDNLSDMLSANVSGRGTPNISGRDTPLSQAESQSGDDRRAPDLPVTVQKNNREDVTERFGKFEIKAELERDETKSTVSDTWSTDVLASDSEPPEQNALERLEEVAEEMARQNLEVSEVSETASDAWSTDVLASDTDEKEAERLLELDQDDTGSVGSKGQSQPEEEFNNDEAQDTPLASGGESPNEERSFGDLGAVGGAVGGLPPNPPLENYFQSIASTEQREASSAGPPSRPDRFSDAGGQHSNVAFRNPFAVMAPPRGETTRPRAVSDIVGRYSKLEQSKHMSMPGNRVSTSFKYAEGKVDTVLSSIDPLGPKKGKRSIPSSEAVLEESQGDSQESLVDSGIAQGSLSTVVVDSPDQGFSSPDFDPFSPTRAPSTASNLSRENRDSGVPETPQDEPPDGSSSGSPFLGFGDGVKLTEQQNLNIDEKRLSTAVAMFDPILLEEEDTSLEDVRSRSVSEPPRQPKHEIGTEDAAESLRKQLPQTGGAFVPTKAATAAAVRPLVAPGISVQDTDMATKEVFTPDKSGTVLRETHSESKAPRTVSDHILVSLKSTGAGSVSFSGPRAVSADLEPLAANDLGNLSNGSSEPGTKSRSSTGSSNSSGGAYGDPSTGAIPKTISFESRGEDKENDNDGRRKGSSIFKAFKERFHKGSKRKGLKQDKDEVFRSFDSDRGAGGDARLGSLPNDAETGDDILNKYRKKPMGGAVSYGNNGDTANQSKEKERTSESKEDDIDGPPDYDPNNLESCKAFLDAKRKLRMVLSTADLQMLPSALTNITGRENSKRENELVSFLKVQLAEAINLQDKALIAQLHETIRCIRQFDNYGIKKLLKNMKEDYKQRAAYIAYMVRCRQGLLVTHAHLDRLLNRVQRDKEVCNKYFILVCVRMFLEKCEQDVLKFMGNFQRHTVSDEKTLIVEDFLMFLTRKMGQDPMWQAATESQLEDARLAIERFIMSRIYTHAVYPNSDGDIMRDQILHEHMQKLAQSITPTNKYLRIPKVYHYECPWPSAQAQIVMINAYKTPKDKLQCVLRCSSTIMNLLSMASEKSVPAADDFMPVLIFVLIKANPPSLLSTVQYVNSFYEKRLQGEEQYWWMQFSSAIEFIKTMDYVE